MITGSLRAAGSQRTSWRIPNNNVGYAQFSLERGRCAMHKAWSAFENNANEATGIEIPEMVMRRGDIRRIRGALMQSCLIMCQMVVCVESKFI